MFPGSLTGAVGLTQGTSSFLKQWRQKTSPGTSTWPRFSPSRPRFIIRRITCRLKTNIKDYNYSTTISLVDHQIESIFQIQMRPDFLPSLFLQSVERFNLPSPSSHGKEGGSPRNKAQFGLNQPTRLFLDHGKKPLKFLVTEKDIKNGFFLYTSYRATWN